MLSVTGQPSLVELFSEVRITVGESCINERKGKRISQVRKEKEHHMRMGDREDTWDVRRPDVLNRTISCTTFTEERCRDCGQVTTACVKCESCPRMLCFSCDETQHSKLVLHDRLKFDGRRRIFLSQYEFINSNGEIFEKGNYAFIFKPFLIVYLIIPS